MKWLKLIGVILVVIVVIFGIKALQVKKQFAGFAAAGEPMATVSAVKLALQEWNPSVAAVGTLRAVRGVDVSSEVSGQVQSVRFVSGDDVEKGETLVQLVSDSDTARLASLQATLTLAETTLARSKAQREADVISQAQLDSDAAAVTTAAAAVREQQALVLKKTIRAPFSGKAGITTVNPGQFLQPGEKIVSVQQLDPIHVDFTVPQDALGSLAIGQKVSASTDAGLASSGEIRAIEPVVDAGTRNVKVLATLSNPDGKLLPGMFVKVQVASGAPQRYLTLPATAVTFNPYGETAFVIMDGETYAKEEAERAKANGTAPVQADAKAPPPPPAVDEQGNRRRVAKQVLIKTGPTRGDQVAVLSGLKEGDEVVTSGQLKLKNGIKVVVDNSVQPSNDPAPLTKDE